MTAVCTGVLTPEKHKRDVLLVGTPTNVLAYDVNDNADLFYKEVCTCLLEVLLNNKICIIVLYHDTGL